MNILSILGGNAFVMFNKDIARKVSVNGAIIFGQLCSSFESFRSKDMLTIKNNKEYFFLTSDSIEGETSLTYKQQLKAIKELEQAGYIETKVMGVPSKKYFHITEKIIDEYLSKGNPSSDKREDLNESTLSESNGRIESNPIIDQKEILGVPKGNTKPLQKGSTIKKKKEKQQNKNNNLNIDNYQETITKSLEPNQFRKLMTDITNDFYTEFATGRWSKKEWNTLVTTFVDEIIREGRYLNIPKDKMRGYTYKSLLNMADHADYKKSDEYLNYLEVMQTLHNKKPYLQSNTSSSPFYYNWLEN